ncbi:hypothetical protein ANO11243_030130 [Dothideomycetidae sp. 11243]|nr:hypothetical protein ANO11243_030130 [fungal sp. No.11243]
MSPPPPIRACLFDMDGLLLDSEDKYTACVNTVLHAHGRPSLPWSIKAQLQGRPGPEAGQIFSAWAKLPISDAEFLEQQAAEQRRIFPSCKPLPGVETLLQRFSRGRVEMALATSSHERNFRLKTDHLTDLFGVFGKECTILGDDPRIARGRGKPCPDIYLLALKAVNGELARRREKGEKVGEDVTPAECLVFEDSVPGVEAGRRAGMQVLWVPHLGLLGEYKGKEKEVLAGRSGMVHAHTAKPSGEGEVEDDMAIPPGEIDDGWGRMILSLEDFDYASYGIKA